MPSRTSSYCLRTYSFGVERSANGHGAVSQGNAYVIWRESQPAVGCWVTFRCRIFRRAWPRSVVDSALRVTTRFVCPIPWPIIRAPAALWCVRSHHSQMLMLPIDAAEEAR